MDHGSQPKSLMTAVTCAWEPHCLNRADSMLNITNRWQDPKISIFCYNSISRKIRSRAETLVSKFRADLSFRLRNIAEKQVPVKLKPIVVYTYVYRLIFLLLDGGSGGRLKLCCTGKPGGGSACLQLKPCESRVRFCREKRIPVIRVVHG